MNDGGLVRVAYRLSQPKEQFFGIHMSNHGRVMIFAGGIPLKRDGVVVGAIGVRGGMGEQDQAVAEAGVKAFDSESSAVRAGDVS